MLKDMRVVELRLDELAKAAGISPRTVRYYVQRGLLPAPAFRGKDTAYGHEHLVRLHAIKRLQEAYFPLDAIAAELEGRTLSEIERFVDGKNVPAPYVGPGHGHGHANAHARDPDPDPGTGQVFRRIALFPGVDLTVADDAPPQSVRLVKEMMEILEAMKLKERGRR